MLSPKTIEGSVMRASQRSDYMSRPSTEQRMQKRPLTLTRHGSYDLDILIDPQRKRLRHTFALLRDKYGPLKPIGRRSGQASINHPARQKIPTFTYAVWWRL